MTCTSGAATDTGMIRERNEDRYWIDPDRGIYLVVDGVGGQSAGEIAAETAVESIRESIGDAGDAEARVRRAIALANNRIFELAQSRAGLSGMACVLTLALVEDGRATIGHVGDSRLYLIRRGAIRKLTRDHSPVGEGEDSGALSEAEAMQHPRRNEIYRQVGGAPHDPADAAFIEIRRCRIRPDSALLLCSDGLTGHLTAEDIRQIAEGYAGDAEAVARDLVEAANLAGGRDNITALFVAGPQFRAAVIARLVRSRIALLTGGLLLGMTLWAALRALGVIR